MVEVGQQSGEVFFHHVGEFDEMLQSDASRLIDPGCEEGLRQFSIRKVPEHAEIFFQEVGLIQGLVDFHQFHESFQGAGFEMFHAAQKEKTASLQDLPFLAAELSV